MWQTRYAQPVGTGLANGGTCGFGNVIKGETGNLVFAITNSGNLALSGLALTTNGPDAAMFTVTGFTGAPVAPGSSTTFTVQFTPTSFGSKTGAIHIQNNDTTANPFDVNLTGTGIRPPTTVIEFQ